MVLIVSASQAEPITMTTRTALETEPAFLDITTIEAPIAGRIVDEDDAAIALMDILDDMMAAAQI